MALLYSNIFHLWNSKHNGSDHMSSIAQYLDHKCKKSKENLQHQPDSLIKFGIGISLQRSFEVDNITKNKANEALNFGVLKAIHAAEKVMTLFICSAGDNTVI